MTITVDNSTRKKIAFICIVCFLVGACLAAALTWDLHMRIMQDAAAQEPIEGTEQNRPIHSGQPKTVAVERAITMYIDDYDAKNETSGTRKEAMKLEVVSKMVFNR